MKRQFARQTRLFVLAASLLTVLTMLALVAKLKKAAELREKIAENGRKLAEEARRAEEKRKGRCEVSRWSAWSPACKGCDAQGNPTTKTQKRTRKVLNESTRTMECPSLEETRACTYTCPAPDSSVKCEVSEWSAWDPPECQCDEQGNPTTKTQKRTRKVLNESTRTMECPLLEETRDCGPCTSDADKEADNRQKELEEERKRLEASQLSVMVIIQTFFASFTRFFRWFGLFQ